MNRYVREPSVAKIPQSWVGPVKIKGPVVDEELMVPLATFESPLWPSTNRGARVTQRSGGINTVITDDRMTRSILLQAPNAVVAANTLKEIQSSKIKLDEVVQSTSRYARLLDIHSQLVGNLMYIRVEVSSGDAAGHNMVTLAADRIVTWLLKKF